MTLRPEGESRFAELFSHLTQGHEVASTKFTLESCTTESHTHPVPYFSWGCSHSFTCPVSPGFILSGRTKVISSQLSVFTLTNTGVY